MKLLAPALALAGVALTTAMVVGGIDSIAHNTDTSPPPSPEEAAKFAVVHSGLAQRFDRRYEVIINEPAMRLTYWLKHIHLDDSALVLGCGAPVPTDLVNGQVMLQICDGHVSGVGQISDGGGLMLGWKS